MCVYIYIYIYIYTHTHPNLFPLFCLLFLHSTMAFYIMHNCLPPFSLNYYLNSLRAGNFVFFIFISPVSGTMTVHGKHSVNTCGGNKNEEVNSTEWITSYLTPAGCNRG